MFVGGSNNWSVDFWKRWTVSSVLDWRNQLKSETVWYFVGFLQICTMMLIIPIDYYHILSLLILLLAEPDPRQQTIPQEAEFGVPLISQLRWTTVSTRHGGHGNKVKFLHVMRVLLFVHCFFPTSFLPTKKHKSQNYVVGHVLYFVAISQLYSHNINNFIVIRLWLYSYIITTVSHVPSSLYQSYNHFSLRKLIHSINVTTVFYKTFRWRIDPMLVKKRLKFCCVIAVHCKYCINKLKY